jgi:hypothetical protein
MPDTDGSALDAIERRLDLGPVADVPPVATAFVFFLLRDHVPACVIEKAALDANKRRAMAESFPELWQYAESVTRCLLVAD